MRIGYLSADLGIPANGVKGASAHVRGLVRAFVTLGHEVVLVAPVSTNNGASGYEAQLRTLGAGTGATVVPLAAPDLAGALDALVEPRLARALGHLWNNLGVERALREAFTGRRPDLLYERLGPFGIAGGLVARELRIPHVLEVNAPLAWEGRTYRRQALSEAAQTLEQAAFACADRLVVVSRELRSILAEAGVPEEKITVVPNGVDAALFTPEGDVATGPFSGQVVVGFVGSLKPWHGIDLLAEAFERLASDCRCHLLVVGTGPEEPLLRDLARRHPERVTLAGAVPHEDVPRYLRAMDIAVAPYPALTKFYFSPLKVLEYMAAGRAVVASAQGQLTTWIEDGKTGVLVPPGNPAALAAALEALARHPERRQALGRSAALEAARAHDWTRRARTILAWARAETAC